MAKKRLKNKKKDKILEEIAEKLKEIKNEKAEEESEKSDTEEDFDLNTLKFNQFVPSLRFPEDAKIPVLERVASEQPRPVFVGTLPQASVKAPGENPGKEDFRYVPSQGGNNEPKYTEKDSTILREPERVDFARVGREPIGLIPRANQEAFFMHSEPSSQIESSIPEQTWDAERIDTKKAGREDPFKAEKEKYKTYKPKPQKSY